MSMYVCVNKHTQGLHEHSQTHSSYGDMAGGVGLGLGGQREGSLCEQALCLQSEELVRSGRWRQESRRVQRGVHRTGNEWRRQVPPEQGVQNPHLSNQNSTPTGILPEPRSPEL